MKDLSAPASLPERDLAAVESALSAAQMMGERAGSLTPEAVLVSDSGGLGVLVALVLMLLLIFAFCMVCGATPSR